MKLQSWNVCGFLALFCAFSATAAFAQETSSCSLATLNGSYGFTVRGESLVPASTPGSNARVVLVSGVAITEYDGKGHIVSDRDTINDGNVMSHWGLSTGSYLVNPDCTGSFELRFTDPRRRPVHADFIIVDGGKRIRIAVTDPHAFITAIGDKL